MYHAIGAAPRSSLVPLFVSQDAFRRQLDLLARRRSVVSLEALVRDEREWVRPPVAITFDDAYRSVLTDAAPLLQSHGFPATVFVPTGWIGRKSAWDSDATEVPLMTADELREAREMGIELESHGHAHIDLGAAPIETAREDLLKSCRVLSSIRGDRPRYFAAPWGSTSPALGEVVRAAGFQAAFSIDAASDDAFWRERIGVSAFDGLFSFAAKSSGMYLRVRHARAFRLAYGPFRAAVNRRRDRRRA